MEGCPRIVLRKGPLLHNLVQQRAAANKVHDKHGMVLVVVTAVQRRHAWVQRHETHRLQFIHEQSPSLRVKEQLVHCLDGHHLPGFSVHSAVNDRKCTLADRLFEVIVRTHVRAAPRVLRR